MHESSILIVKGKFPKQVLHHGIVSFVLKAYLYQETIIAIVILFHLKIIHANSKKTKKNWEGKINFRKVIKNLNVT